MIECEVSSCIKPRVSEDIKWCKTHHSRVKLYSVPEWDHIPVSSSPGVDEERLEHLSDIDIQEHCSRLLEARGRI